MLSRSKQPFLFSPTDLCRKAPPPPLQGLAGARAAVWHRLAAGTWQAAAAAAASDGGGGGSGGGGGVIGGLDSHRQHQIKEGSGTKDGVHLPGWAELLDGSLRSATETRS